MTHQIRPSLLRSVLASDQLLGRPLILIAGPTGPTDRLAEDLARVTGFCLIDRFEDSASTLRAALRGDAPFLVQGTMTIPNSLGRLAWRAAPEAAEHSAYLEQVRSALAGCVGAHRDYRSHDPRLEYKYFSREELILSGAIPPPWDTGR